MPKMYKKARFIERFFALLVDAFVVGIASIVVALFIPSIRPFEGYVFFLISVMYGSIFIWRIGATPGKMLLKLKVLSTTYQPVGFGWALLRESIGKELSGLLFYLGYLWVLIDKKRQAWHDKIARTVVVKLDAKGNLIPLAEEAPITTSQTIMFVFLFALCCLPLIFLIVYIFLFRPFQMYGDSMYPNYTNGEYLMTSVKYAGINRGDVIIFRSPVDIEKDSIKRVIGLPGDTIMINNGIVYLNGKQLDESTYLPNNTPTYQGAFLHNGDSVTVPPESYFVMGDNRPYSEDSREWGFVHKENVISKVTFCYWNCRQ